MRDYHDAFRALTVGADPRNIDILRVLHATTDHADPLDPDSNDGRWLVVDEIADRVDRDRDVVRQRIDDMEEEDLVSCESGDDGVRVEITDVGDVVPRAVGGVRRANLGADDVVR